MKMRNYLILTTIAGLMSLVIFAYLHEWIIIRGPTHFVATTQQAAQQATKKKVALIFWRNNKWHTEHHELLWSPDTGQTVTYLINSWLTLLDEEQVIDKKITLQSALVSATGNDVYLSFDRNPLSNEQSTFHAWMFIEGILKTLRDNGIKAYNIHFLVHHQPLHDPHLDFSNPWPITGFFEHRR